MQRRPNRGRGPRRGARGKLNFSVREQPRSERSEHSQQRHSRVSYKKPQSDELSLICTKCKSVLATGDLEFEAEKISNYQKIVYLKEPALNNVIQSDEDVFEVEDEGKLAKLYCTNNHYVGYVSENLLSPKATHYVIEDLLTCILYINQDGIEVLELTADWNMKPKSKAPPKQREQDIIEEDSYPVQEYDVADFTPERAEPRRHYERSERGERYDRGSGRGMRGPRGSHSSYGSPSRDAPRPESSSSNMSRGRGDCYEFMNHGTCSRGDSCRFNHPGVLSSEEISAKQASHRGRYRNRSSGSSRQSEFSRSKESVRTSPKKPPVSLNVTSYLERLMTYAETKEGEKLSKEMSSDVFELALNSDDLQHLVQIEQVLMLFRHPEFLETLRQSDINKSYTYFAHSKLLLTKLPKFIRTCATKEQLQLVIDVFAECLERCPEGASNLSFADLLLVAKQKDEKLYSRCEELRDAQLRCEQFSTSAIMEEKAPASKEKKPASKIAEIPVYPCLKDFKNKPLLYSNKVDVPYGSVREYIDTHFLLLREDFIQPLRKGLRQLAKHSSYKIHGLPIYTDVRYRSILIEKGSISVAVSFKTEAKFVNWKVSTFLMYGSVVCLFPSDLRFPSHQMLREVLERDEDPIICVVWNRDFVEEQIVHLSFYRDEDFTKFDLRKSYVMVESPTYFHAVEPVLSSLQSMSEDIPFKDILLGSQTTPSMPKYIAKYPYIDLSLLYSEDADNRSLLPFDIRRSFVSQGDTYLDESQLATIRHILTSDVSIVQGPPGTGKSFVGSIAVKLILRYIQSYHRQSQISPTDVSEQGAMRPIVCICLTNHALDQFLEGLIEDVPNLIRIGGQSKSTNEMLQAQNLSAVMRNRIFGGEIRLVDAQIHRVNDEIQDRIKLKQLYTKDIILNYLPLLAQQLRQVKHGTQSANVSLSDGLLIWLNGTEAEFLKHQTVQPKFKNLDEAFKEVEAMGARESRRPVENPESSTTVSAPEASEQLDLEQESSEEDLPEVGEEEESVDINLVESEIKNLEDELKALHEVDEMDIGSPPRKSTSSKTDQTPEEQITSVVASFEEFISSIEQQLVTSNCWGIPSEQRLGFVKKIEDEIKKKMELELGKLFAEAKTLFKRRNEIRESNKLNILKAAPVIGLTSTSAAIHKKLLERLRPRVLLFEEAGELLEAQILAVLNKDVEHLILIGDEKQLRPKAHSFDLEKQHKFAISMFERLIRRKVKTSVLQMQQRMRPEISKLVKPFYARDGVTIYDHARTHDYPNVSGVSCNVRFITHNVPEEKHTFSRSKCNQHEAEFAAALSEYLVKQKEYTPQDITIITPYKGQMYCIKKLLIAAKIETIRCVTVDDFQGEESNIVIISLVRSNKEESVGFVAVQNRIVVALSRAKHGLFVIGNSKLLNETSDDWYMVLSQMKADKKVQPFLELCCSRHKSKLKVQKAADFTPWIHGGCTESCNTFLRCGHICGSKCHSFDSDHEKVKCRKKCDKQFPCGHKCTELCHYPRPCDVCRELIDYTFPECGHSTTIECGVDTSYLTCKHKCGRVRKECGHKCTAPCHECRERGRCKPCEQIVKSKCERCGHILQHKCGSKPPLCMARCSTMLECGHQCSGTCSDCSTRGSHLHCNVPCKKRLICGHGCEGRHSCSQKGCPSCHNKCQQKCVHGTCPRKCSDVCIECQEPCKFRCIHTKCTKKCHEVCNRDPCEKRCTVIHPCGHQCQGFCGEACPPCMICLQKKKQKATTISAAMHWKCTISLCTPDDLDFETDRLYMLPDCGHIFLASSLDQYVRSKVAPAGESTTSSGRVVEYLGCPTCKTFIFTAPRYQKETKQVIQEMATVKKKFRELQAMKERKIIVETVLSVEQGAWHKCPNGHYYVIGECTRPMEDSSCPECGSKIGGSNHQLAPGNTRVGEASTVIVTELQKQKRRKGN